MGVGVCRLKCAWVLLFRQPQLGLPRFDAVELVFLVLDTLAVSADRLEVVHAVRSASCDRHNVVYRYGGALVAEVAHVSVAG